MAMAMASAGIGVAMASAGIGVAMARSTAVVHWLGARDCEDTGL